MSNHHMHDNYTNKLPGNTLTRQKIIEHLEADFQWEKGQYLDLSNLTLIGMRFRGANLQFSNFSNSDLRQTDFRQAYLTGVNFQKCNLSSCSFVEADLRGANFLGANLMRAGFYEASYDSSTKFPFGFNPEKRGLILY